jgi:hypothetical protein
MFDRLTARSHPTILITDLRTDPRERPLLTATVIGKTNDAEGAQQKAFEAGRHGQNGYPRKGA